MKNKLFLMLFFGVMACTFASCDTEDPISYENDPAIYFNNKQNRNLDTKPTLDSVGISFTDIKGTEYIYNVYVLVQGEASDTDRTFIMRQRSASPQDPDYVKAEPGRDYTMDQNALVIPAGEVEAVVPITLTMNDFLLEQKVELWLEFADNDNFRTGMKDWQSFKIKFSALPEKPGNWDSLWGLRYFGMTWGPVKHMFIINELGPIAWDEPIGIGTGMYYQTRMRAVLQTYNEENPNNKLAEKDETLVSF